MGRSKVRVKSGIGRRHQSRLTSTCSFIRPNDQLRELSHEKEGAIPKLCAKPSKIDYELIAHSAMDVEQHKTSSDLEISAVPPARDLMKSNPMRIPRRSELDR